MTCPLMSFDVRSMVRQCAQCLRKPSPTFYLNAVSVLVSGYLRLLKSLN